MASSWHPSDHRRDRRGALVAYVVAWLAVGGIIAAVVIVLVRDERRDVVLPPVEQTELAQAAMRAKCLFRRGAQPASEALPVEGAQAPPVPAGAYADEQPQPALVGALRRGMIIIYYRPDLGDDDLEQLREVQRALPRATVLVPKPDMPYQLAVTAWRRLLGCAHFDQPALDAARLFRGRYVGQGPDTPR